MPSSSLSVILCLSLGQAYSNPQLAQLLNCWSELALIIENRVGGPSALPPFTYLFQESLALFLSNNARLSTIVGLTSGQVFSVFINNCPMLPDLQFTSHITTIVSSGYGDV